MLACAVRHGKQGVLLEDDSPVESRAGDRLAVERELPAAGMVSPATQVEQGRLAAAGGTDEHEELTGGDLETHVVEGHELAARRTVAGRSA